MKFLYTIKIVVLICALLGVLAVIRGIDASHVQKLFGTLGADPAGIKPASTQTAPKASTYNLCDTRVHALVWPDGRKIEEFKQGMKMKWYAYDPSKRELDYLAMEKWLGQNCRLRVLEAGGDQQSSPEFKEYIAIEFIDGGKKQVLRSEMDQDLFRIGDQVFRSTEFHQALEDLRKIALFEEKG